MKAKKLSVCQEIKLLRQLKNGKIISNGSSRLVVVDPRNPHRVVKIAIGACSFRQNKFEINFWNLEQDERLATIYEYGRFVVVMERMESTYNDDSIMNSGFSEEEYDDAVEIVHWLNDKLGETADNWQLGLVNGRWKSYDYGFDPEADSGLQCGSAEMINSCNLKRFLNEAITLLRNKQPITQIESWINEN